MLIVFGLSAIGLVILMLLLYAVGQRIAKVGVVDVGWAYGTAAMSVLVLWAGEGDPWRRGIAAALIGVWGIRLGTYLLTNRVMGAEEDGRYRALLEHWGASARWKLLWFYLAQAVFAVVFVVPMLPVASSPRTVPQWHDLLALLVWLISVSGEALADRQLARWRANAEHRGLTCRAGLWRYSRHPNYFFEWLHWWAYPLLALGISWWWVSLLGPVLMLAFLYRFTGIPYTEAQALRSRGEDYRDYQERTSAFIPWFPRKS